MLCEIEAGNIILAFEGSNLKGICEIPSDFVYYFDGNLDYPNCLFPVQWIDWEVFCSNTKLKKYKQGGQGIAGIENCGLKDINTHINQNWEKYKKTNKIDVFPKYCIKKHQDILSNFDNAKNQSRYYLEQHKKRLEQKNKMQKYINLLLQKHQVILTGAPGTGKTYLAREIAQDMIGKGNENLQIAFVQFHPSYDYTDFVEGLRPVQKDSQISFELKNGAFKEFCRVAGVVERAFVETKDAPLTSELLEKLLGNKEAVDFWKQHQANFQKWYDALKKWHDNPKEVAYPYEVLNDLPKFVFIIDEVNRAEISKVFGELMFSIDEGYRGIAGKVKTQYANIQTNATFFTDKANDYFFVPSNVYILGTMNDIDRSVETFDFAMRRRFAWLEISVEETQESILKDLPEAVRNEAISKMNAINALIIGKDAEDSKKMGLNKSYCIGASYFGKLKSDNSFDNLWAYHLEPLLREYLRGLPDAENKLKTLKTAYDNAKS